MFNEKNNFFPTMSFSFTIHVYFHITYLTFYLNSQQK